MNILMTALTSILLGFISQEIILRFYKNKSCPILFGFGIPAMIMVLPVIIKMYT